MFDVYNVEVERTFYSPQCLFSIVWIFAHRTSLGNKSRDGNTPLHLCAIENKTECMKLLLRTRPELAKIENSEGKTPLDIAKENNNQLCADLVCVLRFCCTLYVLELFFMGLSFENLISYYRNKQNENLRKKNWFKNCIHVHMKYSLKIYLHHFIFYFKPSYICIIYFFLVVF